MHHVHLVGCASALFDNLAVSWKDDLASCEVSDLESLPAAIDRICARRPDWIVYCGNAAHSSWESRAASYCENVQHVERLARVAVDVDARLVVISSDRVVAGPRMFKDENEPAAVDPCAHELHAIEHAALAADKGQHRVLVVRTNAFGWSVGGETFAERIWNSLEARESVELDASSHATPILASDLAQLLVRCFRACLHGVLHLGGAERTSPFRFAQELARAAGFNHRLVHANAQAVEGFEELVNSCETSLGSRLVRRELDVPLPLLHESVCRFALQASDGYRDRIRSDSATALPRAA